ncbi:MAG: transporter [Rhizobiales bacterium]|nr:transporter [Hyphomicrobiales bacterium]
MACWDRRLECRVHGLVLAGAHVTPARPWAAKLAIRAWAAGALLAAFPIGIVEASDPGSGHKSQYTLFNPTPDRLLRDLTTDRPDTTESPFTVDAGHVQVETNLFGYTRSRPDVDGTVTDSYDFLTTNVRIGLTNASEINVAFQPYGIVRTRPLDPLLATRSSGVGGVDIRAKFNLWGNDTFDRPGATAFALLPFVTLPTDRSNGISPDGVEGGLILPFAVKLSDKFGLGLNAGVHVVRNSDVPGHHAEYLTSAALSYEWTAELSSYYEVAARFNTDNPLGDVAVLATGFTYKLSKNLQLDSGIRFGATRAADRVNPFFGVSARY